MWLHRLIVLLWLASCTQTKVTHAAKVGSFRFADARGQTISTDAFVRKAGMHQAVCVGERHDNAAHHAAQAKVVSLLGEARGAHAVGFEMIEARLQGIANDYNRGIIDADELGERLGFEARWGRPFADYRPIIIASRQHDGMVLALNAPRELVKKIGRGGIDALEEDEKSQLPTLDLSYRAHREWFDNIMNRMAGHGHGARETKRRNKTHAAPDPHKPRKAPGAVPKSAPKDDAKRAHGHAHGHHQRTHSRRDNFYAAQVTWDVFMAATAKRHIDARGTPIYIIAGSGHCHKHAIPYRLQQQGMKSLSVRPVGKDESLGQLVAEGLFDVFVLVE